MIRLFVINTKRVARDWDTSVLDSAEVSRAKGILMHSKRDSWIRSRILLKEILSAQLLIQPRQLQILRPQGKPEAYVNGSRASLGFNLSRSDPFVSIAVREQGRIGVDIESIRPIKNRSKKVNRFFCSHERDYTQSIQESERNDAFLRLWTAKEAWLKAVGSGINALPITQVCASVEGSGRYLHTDQSDPADWGLRFERSAQFMTCIAYDRMLECDSETVDVVVR